MNRKVAIIQSNYIPWRGYFNIIKCVDHFVLLDDVQYTRRDWRNRNLIKTRYGLKWLTIPVKIKGKYLDKICTIETDGDAWRKDHWNQIQEAYREAPFFNDVGPPLKELYLSSAERNLSSINFSFIRFACTWLKINTPIQWSMDVETSDDPNLRLVQICRSAGATTYFSGEAARDYLDPVVFNDHGITVHWVNYQDFPPYHQLFPPFSGQVSVIDLLLNEGPGAAAFLKASV